MDVSHFQNQLGEIIGDYEAGIARSNNDDGSDISKGPRKNNFLEAAAVSQ